MLFYILLRGAPGLQGAPCFIEKKGKISFLTYHLVIEIVLTTVKFDTNCQTLIWASSRQVIYSFQKSWPPRACCGPPEGIRVLSFATELAKTLVQVLRKFEYSSLMVLHSVRLNDVKLFTVKKVDFKKTKCNLRFKRI